MSRKKEPLLTDEWLKLKRQLEAGKPQPLPLPMVLPLKAIRMWPAVFQHRGPKGADGDRHVRTLAASIRKSKTRTLDPVRVWWDGKGWACIDGHHRIDAYKVAAVGGTHTVPVQAFEGTQDEAMSEAASGNTKDKLSMSGAEKSNTAWRMVVVTAMSKANVAMASGVSESTVANMRRVHAQLTARVTGGVDDMTLPSEPDHGDISWANAKRLADDREAHDFDWEAANMVKAQTMATALRKALGAEGAKYPEVLAMALDIYDRRLMDRLVEWWGDRGDIDEVEERHVGVSPGQPAGSSDF